MKNEPLILWHTRSCMNAGTTSEPLVAKSSRLEVREKSPPRRFWIELGLGLP